MRTNRRAGRQSGWQLAVTAALVLMLLVAPASLRAAAPAQEGTLDPAVLAAIQQAAAHVTGAMGQGGPAVVAGPAGDTPVEPTPEPTEEPVAEPDAPLEVVIGESVEYVTPQLSLMVPENWSVEEGEFGTLLAIADEAAGMTGEMQDFGDQFPGLLVFPIFEGQADAIVGAMGNNAEFVSAERISIEQGLPALRIEFRNAEDDDKTIDGVIYLFSSGSTAYGLFLGAGSAEWPQLVDAVDAMAASLQFNEAEIDLMVAGDEGLVVDDPEGDYSLAIPAGWLATPTEDDDLHLVLSDPAVQIVAAVATRGDLEDDSQLQALTGAIAGALDEDDAAALADDIVGMLDLGQEGINIDSEQTAFFPVEGDALGVIRMVGEAPIEGGPTLPMSLYLGIYTDKIAVLIVFGDGATVRAVEADLVGVIDSLQFTE